MPASPTTGFLNEDFRLFHLSDQGSLEFNLHCHDFYKIMILLRGNVTYVIEGRSYALSPLDFVLVNRGQLHRPLVDGSQPYERFVFYLKPSFLEGENEKEDLSSCFQASSYRHSNVLRPEPGKRQSLISLIKQLETSLTAESSLFASSLYSRLLCQEFLIQLNRFCLAPDAQYLTSGTLDYRVSGLISYINDNLDKELSLKELSGISCLSPYHMMRLFKSQAGCTLGQYIAKKRLVLARELISQGESATKACFQCGFGSYSSFLRAYKKQYGELPKRKPPV